MIENDPRVVFERLFGAADSTDRKVRELRLHQNKSILDSVTAKVTSLSKQLGGSDSTKVADYLDSLRDVERRIQKAEEQSSKELPSVEKPSGIPNTFEEHMKLMFDLQVLAWQTDLTRVITFMVGRELSPRSFPQLGIGDGWHGLSHHQDDPEKLEKLAKLQAYMIDQFAYFLGRLKETPDGEGSLLDHSMVLWGTGIGNSDRHYHHDLPVVVAGGGAG